MPAQPSPLEFSTLLLLIVFGGTLGGCAQILARLITWSVHRTSVAELKENERPTTYIGIKDENLAPLDLCRTFSLCVINAVVGASGAFGLIGVFCLIQVFRPDDMTMSPHSLIKILGVGVIGGFVARVLLPVLGENLAARVNSNEQKIDQNKDEIDKAKIQLQSAEAKLLDQSKASVRAAEQIEELNYKLKVERAISTLFNRDEASSDVWLAAKSGIADLYELHPDDREIAILQARFAVERRKDDILLPDYVLGIDILERCISKSSSNHHKSDMLVNVGCYCVALMKNPPHGRTSEDLKKKALDCIRECCSLEQANKEFCAKDTDLEPLWNDPDFLAIVSPHQPKRTGETG